MDHASDDLRWHEVRSTDGEQPSPRWSAAGFYYNDGVYIHGGRNLECFLDDLWRFSLSEQRWEKVPTTATSGRRRQEPPPVNGHSLVRCNDKAYLFGGSCSFGRERRYLGDTYKLDLKTFQWTLLLTPTSPTPRYWHSVTNVVEDCFYLVGGFAFAENGKECYCDDIWKFDIEQGEWAQVSPDGDELHRRNRCGAAMIDSSTMVVFGGNYFDGNKSRDVFLSSLSIIQIMGRRCTVSQVPCTKGTPVSLGHSSFLRISGDDDLKFLIFGGEDGKQRFNDVQIMSLTG